MTAAAWATLVHRWRVSALRATDPVSRAARLTYSTTATFTTAVTARAMSPGPVSISTSRSIRRRTASGRVSWVLGDYLATATPGPRATSTRTPARSPTASRAP